MEKTKKLEWDVPKLVRLGSDESTEGQAENCMQFGHTAGGVCEYTGVNAAAGCIAGSDANVG